MAEEVVLVDFWASPFAMRVRIALREKDVEFESREEEDLLGAKSSLLLKMNPVHKKVPVLIHNGRPICESRIIVEYIDETWNHKSPLLPSDPQDRSRARFWADYIDKKFHPLGRSARWGSTSEKETQEAAKAWIECCKVLEEELGEKDYFGGQSFGLVDVCLIPFHNWFHSIETVDKVRAGNECPKLVSWAQRCTQRETVSKTLPDPHKQNELLLSYKKRLQAAQAKA